MTPSSTPLTALLTAQIRATGPLTVAEFMTLALQHPEHGYYRRQEAVGAAADFVTAPEISQVFGELMKFLQIGNLSQIFSIYFHYLFHFPYFSYGELRSWCEL